MEARIITKEIMDYVYEKDGWLYWKNDRGNLKCKNCLAGRLGTRNYYVLQINNVHYFNHRILYQFYHNIILDPDQQIDHINGIKDDNRKCNLRISTHSQNQMNKKTQKNNKLGLKNISKNTNKAGNEYYVLQIKHNKKLYQKIFRTDKFSQEDVIKIRDEKLKEYHGDFYNSR